MALYPATPVPQYPHEISEVWKTTITAFDGTNEQRRQKQLFPKYDMNIVYNTLTTAEFELIWDFYRARRGAYDAFYVYLRDVDDFDGLGVGVGDGAEDTFDLPGKSTSSQKIYLNGVEQTVTTHYSISAGTGNEAADQVVFVTAPGANVLITCDFAGYFRNRCRFAEDKLTRTQFVLAAYSTGIQLKGLRLF
jgi:hypothetical protein